jgi:hypothetical protein
MDVQIANSADSNAGRQTAGELDMRQMLGDEYLQDGAGHVVIMPPRAGLTDSDNADPDRGAGASMPWHMLLMILFGFVLLAGVIAAASSESLAGLFLFLDPTVLNYL